MHEKLSTLVFEHHVYLKRKEVFQSYGIDDCEVKFIKELIDHDLSTPEKLEKPQRTFL